MNKLISHKECPHCKKKSGTYHRDCQTCTARELNAMPRTQARILLMKYQATKGREKMLELIALAKANALEDQASVKPAGSGDDLTMDGNQK